MATWPPLLFAPWLPVTGSQDKDFPPVPGLDALILHTVCFILIHKGGIITIHWCDHGQTKKKKQNNNNRNSIITLWYEQEVIGEHMILCGLVFNSYVAENRIRPTYFYFTLVSHRIIWSRVNRDLKLINGSVIIHQNQLIYKDQSTKNIFVNLL